MVFSGIELKDTFNITNAMIGTTQAFEIDVQANSGLSHVLLEVGIDMVGSGALTIMPMCPFGLIAQLRILDQNGSQLGLYTGYELVVLSYALGKVNPFETVQFDDGTTGWSEVPDSTTIASGEEIKGLLHLPVRIGKAKKISKLKFEVTFSGLNSTTGIQDVGDFATSFTSATGSLRAHPVYDDGIVETWYSHIFPESSVGTSFTVFKDPPRGAKIRYAAVILPDFWAAQNGTTDDETLIDEFEFRQDTKLTPIRLNQWTARYMTMDFLDADVEFGMSYSTVKAWNWFILTLPDLPMGENSRFALKNQTSQDARLLLIEVQPDPTKEKQSKAISPAVITRFLKG